MLSLPSARWLLLFGLLLVGFAGCQRGAEQFTLLDANKDGQLSGEELDVNRDGTISPDEVQVKSTYTRRVEEFLADGDSTDDKQLTPAEFDRALLGKQMPFWMIAIIVVLVIGIPVPLGFQLAKNFRMPDHGWKIALILLLITAAGAITYFGWPPKLGIDLSGGVILIYEIDEEATLQQGVAEDAKPGDALRDDERINIDDVVSALRKRVNPGGVKEVIIRPYGDRQVEIIVPEVEAAEVDYIKELIQRTGQLEFLIVANREDHKEIIDKATSPELLPARERSVAQAGDWKGRWVPVGVEERQREKEPDYQGAGLGDVLRAKQGDSDRFVQVDVPTNLQREISNNSKNLKQVLDQLGYRDLQVLMAVNPMERFNIKGSHLRSAMKSYDGSLNPAVNFTMKPEGAALLERLTSDNLPDTQRDFYRRMAIIMDGEVISAPRLMSTIGRDGQITGNFTEREVDLLVETLRSGRLPAVLRKEPISQSEVSALLGADTIRQGGIAIAASLVITLVFMLFYYRFAGAVACMALLLNLLFTVAAMIAIRAAFTLPGIAGLVLGVGMSVDANILIFERIREEMQRGAGLRMALRNGFSRAATTIIDSNMTTLITAVVLYAIGTEQIKGFAVTLILGLLISMFTAIFCARVVFDIAERQRWIAKLSMTQWIKATNFDFIAKQRLAIGGSILLILIGMGAIFARGKNIFDIDFAGGTSVQVLFKQPQPIDEVRAAVTGGPLGDTSVTLVSVEGYKEGQVYKIDSPITGEEEPAVGDPVTFTVPGTTNTLSLRIAKVDAAEQKADLVSDDGKQKFNGVRWRDFQRDGVRIVQDQLMKIFAGKLAERSVEVASIESLGEAPPSGNTTGEASDDDLKPETTPESTTPDEPAGETGESTETPATETPATETPATETPATETPATETPATETPSTEAPATETPPSTDTPPSTEPAVESTEEPAPTEGTSETPPAGEAPSATPPATETGESPASEAGSRLDRPATFVFTSYQADKEEGADPTEPTAEPETPATSDSTESPETPATTDTTPETGSVTEVGPDEVAIDEPGGETVQVLGLGRTVATLKFGEKVNSPTVTAAIKKAAAGQLGILNLPGVRLENPDWDGSPDRRYNEWQVELPLEKATAERVLASMQKELQGSPVWLSSSKIGPQIAGDLSEKALAALIFATLGIVIYIWFRFHRAVFGVAAVIAMLHDVIITVGMIGISYYLATFAGFLGIDEFKINMTIVAAILTVIGYSLNDTVVVFDRIREVRGKSPDLTVAMVNQSVNQTLSRTLLTSFTTILSLLAMYIIGGPSIRGFAFTLLVGIVVGTFSSVYIASPCLLWLMKISKQAPNRPEKVKKADLTKAS